MNPRIPRIPEPVINNLPPPVIDRLPPPVVDFVPPPVLAPPSVEIPSYEPPSFEPPDVPTEPNTPPPVMPGTEPKSEEEESPERPGLDIPEVPGAPIPRPEIEVPFVGTVPLPYQREVALAGTTAVAATAAAIVGKSLVETLLRVMKPIVRRIMLRLKEKMGKRQFTDYEIQLFFAFEGRTPEQKQVMKRLEKELEEEKQEQLEEYLQSRQSRQKHKGSADEIEHQLDEPPHSGVVEQVRNQVEP